MSAVVTPAGSPSVLEAVGNRPLVEVDGIAKIFDVSAPWLNRVLERKPRLLLHAVDGVSFAIERGETLALVGESGCGKSTVARMLVGLYRPTRGRVSIDGHDLAELSGPAGQALRRRIQMIFQDPYASLNPRWKVADIIAEPIRVHRLLAGEAAIRERVGELLRHVGLAPVDAARFPHQFSGGQRQRISIARALASQAEFLVCDEPTSALDPSLVGEVMRVIKRLSSEGRTMVIVTHEVDFARNIATRVLFMKDGSILKDTYPREFFESASSEIRDFLTDLSSIV